MDECFVERLVYSDSDNNEEETIHSIKTSIKHQLSNNTVSDESDEDNLNKSFRRSKKNTRILSSDDEKVDVIRELDVTESKKSTSVRPSICDSDTKSSGDENKNVKEIEGVQKKTRKLKKKKRILERPYERDSNSESDDECGDNEKKQHTKSNQKQKSPNLSDSSSDSTNSDSNVSGEEEDVQNTEPRVKPIQRISAKMAEQQMKEIQSESQRMAREHHVSIPYHKPKQHSLKEFLGRRSIAQQHKKVVSKPFLKTAIAIKMTGDDLIQYMVELEKRNEEAEEFFQEQEEEGHSNSNMDESDDSDYGTGQTFMDDSKTIDKPSETEPNELHRNVAITAILSQQNIPEIMENDNEMVNSNGSEDQNKELSENHKESNVIELHTIRTELDYEIDAMSTTSGTNEVKLSVANDFVPILKGDKGLVIDFESNDLKPAPKTGVEDLLTRFVTNALVKPHVSDVQDVSIFRSDTGAVERHTIHVTLDDKKPNREPKPGESLFKLRTELGLKIKENREKIIAQRLQEEKEKLLAYKQMESEDESEDEVTSDSEKNCEEEIAHPSCTITKELNGEENEDEDINDENIESDSSEGSDDDKECDLLDIDIETKGTLNPRKRILATGLDDDSDNEGSTHSPQNAEFHENEFQEDLSTPTQLSPYKSVNTMNSHDISALESEILQLNSQVDTCSRNESSKLFEMTNGDGEEIGESQLMALCSGSFATQNLDNLSAQDVEKSKEYEASKSETDDFEEIKQNFAFLSSDDDEVDRETKMDRKKHDTKKKRKKNTLVYSDDEDDKQSTVMKNDQSNDGNVEDENHKPPTVMEDGQSDEDDEYVKDEEDPGECFIEYDSDENEVEVSLKKTDVRKKAFDFFEDEAVLSESEWGSDDEDEIGMNRYEAELGDVDKFDKDKLRDELERIRLREQIDDDAREIRILTDRFIEEEDNGQERDRKFRWKHLNNGASSDDLAQHRNLEEASMQNSDDENEAEWRRIRYEREQLLKQQTVEKESFVERTSSSTEFAQHKEAENITWTMATATTATTSFKTNKRISIIKPVNSASPKIISPFLIAKGDLNVGHLSRKSFLNRDNPLLEKLVDLTKSGNENDPILKTTKGKGNYVFVATEKKDNPKRKSETEAGIISGIANPSKKSKVEVQINTKIRPQTKAFFESLN